MRTSTRRWILLACGWFNLGLGFIGLFLPLIPTTPFLLVAVVCFSRSSEKFHNWLIYHPRFGPPMRAWLDHRVISLRAKSAATFLVSCSVGLMWTQNMIPLWLRSGVTAVVVAIMVFVWLQPSRIPEGDGGDGGTTSPAGR